MNNDLTQLPIIITLKPGKEKPVRMGHPWIFSGAIANVSRKCTPGELCTIFSHSGEKLGMGYYNAASAICVRTLSRGSKPFSSSTLSQRINESIGHRNRILDSQTNSCRIINSEGDFLPGLIVDKIGDGFVVQILTAGMELFRSEIIAALSEPAKPSFIYERSDTESRKREGLQHRDGLILGSVPEKVIITENGLSFSVNISGGQKTGFFFDQRNNRQLLQSYAEGRSICDCFSYSGAFSVNACKGNARHIDIVDISDSAITWAKENILLNNISPTTTTFVKADTFNYLRETTSKYDCIILDPPKFAKHPGEVNRAARGYKDINLIALKNLNPGGILFTFSCSQAVDMKLFRQIVFAAAADSGRDIQLLHVLTAGPDHPVNIAHIEGEYLKGLVLRVI